MSGKNLTWTFSGRWTAEQAGEFMGELMDRHAASEIELEEAEQAWRDAEFRLSEAKRRQYDTESHVSSFLEQWRRATVTRNLPENKARHEAENEGISMDIPETLVEGTL